MTKKPPLLSWNDRFALIDAYKPSQVAICAAFRLSPAELKTAMSLRDAGTFAPNPNLDVTKYTDIFQISDDIAPSNTTLKSVTATVHSFPETASKRITTKAPQKRGRKGNKIADALLAVPTTPIAVDSFIQEHGVSVAVLRQAKRFIEKMNPEQAAQVGNIIVKQNKDTKTLMIWKEVLTG
ncbi:MAG: hypothetical protein CTY12_03430 [Methylotenera sp.]|nr:MAG: hypothetical protein CTY12_03430 [Methylotenera sp.]